MLLSLSSPHFSAPSFLPLAAHRQHTRIWPQKHECKQKESDGIDEHRHALSRVPALVHVHTNSRAQSVWVNRQRCGKVCLLDLPAVAQLQHQPDAGKG